MPFSGGPYHTAFLAGRSKGGALGGESTTSTRMQVGVVGETLVPPWLEPLLGTPFFSPCATHGDLARGECNMFCLDCPAAAAFCIYCRSASHADHRAIQVSPFSCVLSHLLSPIRRSSYHDVVRVSEVQRALDVGGVQTYVINSARVVFLNERPLPKGAAASGFGGAAKSPAHVCETCGRALLDPFRFCSLGCKLEGIKKGGDACCVLEVEGNGAGGAAAVAAPAAAAAGGIAADETGACQGTPERAGPARREEAAAVHGGSKRHDMRPPTPPINPRRRKGIPRRAPLTS